MGTVGISAWRARSRAALPDWPPGWAADCSEIAGKPRPTVEADPCNNLAGAVLHVAASWSSGMVSP